MSEIKAVVGEDWPVLMPVLAAEDASNNKIPQTMAEVLADRFGLDIELDIIQRKKAEYPQVRRC
ncbi:hypothetical protein PA01_00185 [Azoarcus sp. PA01]|nr:hypothetical protein PA01_19425 [Azoarcus sp. PA01]KON82512.2 hypothetical protein PA01_00185 [Azoarcus sp. PA01]